MTTEASYAVRVSRTIRADADALFAAWTEPEALQHWWRMDEPGWAFAEATIDLRVGGGYRLGMTGPDGTRFTSIGVYREIDRPRRLVFSWDWEEDSVKVGDTLVTVEFEPAGEKHTEVTITHERFADPARVARHGHGWTQLLGLLDRCSEQEPVR